MSAARLVRAESGFFYVRWTEGRRSMRESTRAKELRAAEAFFSEWLKLRNSPDEQPTTALKLSDLWAAYFDNHVATNVSSQQTAAYAWKNLSAAFADKGPHEIDQKAVQRYVKLRSAGKIGRQAVASTIRRELVVLRAILNWAAAPAQKLIRPDAIEPFSLPGNGKPRERWLTKDEIGKLLEAAKGEGPRLSRVERFLWLALETGARKSAILGLTWDRVDFETRVIDFRDPKKRETKKRRSVVPISKALLPVLERAHTERKSVYVLDHAGEIVKSVYRAAERAGLEGVSPHVFRHTAATHMARSGVPLWKVAKVLGNSAAVTERVYAKHCPEDLRDAVDSLSN